MPLSIVSRGSNNDAINHAAEFHAFGLTPPVTLGLLAIEGSEFEHQGPRREMERFLVFAVMGLGIWAVLAGCLYAAGNEYFREVSGRRSLRCADFAPLRAPPDSRGWG